ncbi:hypothetical protein [Clostridiisalibacter paucivorans]|uniref:hypothetical protein n=1 Tax=Clostridiisalibacter paucivorans TaxID=408753 RepID=UPI0006887DB9|nr:hypothetical protein [Clostridiisalibacter paucivorans]
MDKEILSLLKDIDRKVDGNSKKLDKYGIKLNEYGEKLDEQGKKLYEYGKRLDEHGIKLDEQGKKLDEHGRKLDEQGKKLDEHGRKLDEHGRILRALEEASHVHKAEMDNISLAVNRIEGEVKTIREDLTAVELMTSKNWNDIVKLKAIK